MKNANGYGSITKLKGNRRKPYMVRITVGRDENGFPIRKVLGYYSSKANAVAALSDYNREPYDIASRKLTFSDIYNKWIETKEFDKLSKSAQKCYKAAYKKYEIIHNKVFATLKICDMQNCIDDKMLDVGSPAKTKGARIPYSDEEIDTLWKHTDDDIVKLILIYIYTGVRCNELLYLKKENLHLDEQYFEVVKSKTDSGIRIVPIADIIVPFFKYFCDKSQSQWVITAEYGGRLADSWYRKQQQSVLTSLSMKHTTHEARHTCITQMTIHNVNESVIKEIVGHKSAQSFTERVYTHIYLKTKIDAVNTIHT